MTNFMDQLKAHHGYLLDSMVENAITELGADYPVVIKHSTGQRYYVELQNLQKHEENIFNDPIHGVFVSSNQYDELFAKEA